MEEWNTRILECRLTQGDLTDGKLYGWTRTPVVYDRGKDLSIRLRIGCVFGSRNGIFCRALHTQVLEVIEFAVSRATLKVCLASLVPLRLSCANV